MTPREIVGIILLASLAIYGVFFLSLLLGSAYVKAACHWFGTFCTLAGGA